MSVPATRGAVLALDQGSQSSRACLFDSDGSLLASAQQAVDTVRPAEDRSEHSATELAASLRTVARRCLEQAPAATVVAAGLATQRSSIVCVERGSLLPLSAVISWQDRRNAGWLQQLAPQAARVRALTGLPLSPHYGASKMRWCLEHLPEVQAAAQAQRLCLAPLASYLASALTGAPLLADPANASRTLLWDSARLDWSDELLQLFAIERAWLPRCARTQDDYGVLQVGAASVPLLTVTGDQSAVPFAFGEPDESTVYLNLGTGAFLQRALHTRPADPAPLLASVLIAGGGARAATTSAGALWSLEGTVNGAASAVSWFAGREGCEVAALWPMLTAITADVPLPLFVNGIGGLGSPWWQPQVETRFVGTGAVPQRFAAVLESVLFMIAANLALMQRAGQPAERIVATGGMSQSDWLCQRLADLVCLAVCRGEQESTARGVAMLAAPWLPLQSASSRSPLQRFSPTVQPQAALQARYQAFLTLLLKT